MTRGVAVALGVVGWNAGAGMTGGVPSDQMAVRFPG